MMNHFEANCRKCPRLAAFLKKIRHEHPDYHARPVPPFGQQGAKLLIVGLAPGMHGANATGRPFTGDYAGTILYETLHRFGFANQPLSTHRDDSLLLKGCNITNAVKCLPPKNKPTAGEINTCNQYLQIELSYLSLGSVILALGHVAHKAVVKALQLRQKDYLFQHGKVFDLSQKWLLDSYHCSRYNIHTKRLNKTMFDKIFSQSRELIDRV